ncbi:MAG: LON peptidase substrate-binding domain-containing protein [Natronospirillum sp.]|uniref:LON peptidase substrate-binding domain-containing protein n=1 Tax=Natronospirillum sp. TaxID=2812955 RepID=UPI0025E43214|nr:LON peptidase substrate-binding domain-containing protein [Natronospirillum sp.]MCH8551063.1 LON peptidase substrate-binding domain-containing protein [Natronospirillum sp.]
MSYTPLFPLSQPLFPGCRLPLRIFEPRYLRMVSESSRDGTGFVITLLDKGQEVIRAGTGPTHFHDLGCLCRIVDFEPLSGGLLGITVEGEAETWIGQAHQEDDGLWCAPVHAAETIPLPEDEPVDDLRAVMAELAEHPLLDNLLPPQDIEQTLPGPLLNQLCCWLPMTEVQKQSLLSELDQQQRLVVLRRMLDEWMRA